TVGRLGLHRPPGEPGPAAARLPGTHHRRGAASKAAPALDRLPAPMGSRPVAPPAVATDNTCAAITFRTARRPWGNRGQPVAVALRFPGDSRRRSGTNDRRDRR